MLAALNASQRKLLGGLRGVRRSPHRARMENLSPLRRSSVVSARVYARDCEANVEKERTGWGGWGWGWRTFQHLGLGNGGELTHSLLILMWSHANTTIILWDIILGMAERAMG